MGAALWLPLSATQQLVPGYLSYTYALQIVAVGCLVLTVTKGDGFLDKACWFVPAVHVDVDANGCNTLVSGAPA